MQEGYGDGLLLGQAHAAPRCTFQPLKRGFDHHRACSVARLTSHRPARRGYRLDLCHDGQGRRYQREFRHPITSVLCVTAFTHAHRLKQFEVFTTRNF